MLRWIPGVTYFSSHPWIMGSPFKLGLVADPEIEAIARLEFENGLRMGVLLGGCWCPWGSRTYPRINTKPPWGCGLVLGWVWLS